MGKEHKCFFWKLQHFQLANEEIQQKWRVNIKNIIHLEFFFFGLTHLQLLANGIWISFFGSDSAVHYISYLYCILYEDYTSFVRHKCTSQNDR